MAFKHHMDRANRLWRRTLGYTVDVDGETDSVISNLRCLDSREFYSIGPSPELVQVNPEPPTYVMKFCSVPGYHHFLTFANEDGKVAFQDTSKCLARTTSGRSLGYMRGCKAHSNAIFDVDWATNNVNRFVTVSGDKTARLWDLSKMSDELDCIQVFKGHEKSIKSVSFQPNSNDVFATAGRDNTIRLWDARTKDAENIIRRAHTQTASSAKKTGSIKPSLSNSVTAIRFQDDFTIVSCGDHDGVIKAWDLRRSYSVYDTPVAKVHFPHPQSTSKQGFTSLTIDSSRRFVYASCMDNTIYRFDLNTYDKKPGAMFQGFENSFYQRISLSWDDKYLVSGSKDHHAVIWKAPKIVEDADSKHEPLAMLEGHDTEVTCVDWCRSGWLLASCSDDMSHKLWELDCDTSVESTEVRGKVKMVSNPRTCSSRSTTIGLVRNHYVTTPTVASQSHFLLTALKSQLQLEVMEDTTQLSPSKRVQSAKKRNFLASVANLPCSPSKMHQSPKTFSPKKLPLVSSPTVNLPNFVRDGDKTPARSVHKKRPFNWLDKLTREKKEHCSQASKENRTSTTPKAKRRRKR